MVAKTYILSNLDQIERLYNKALPKSVQKSLFYSKLAIIELGGWTEMSMDDIVLRLASRRLRGQSHVSHIQNVVKKTYGFHYENNFLPMIQAIIGRSGIEWMNSQIDVSINQQFIAALASLKDSRDKLAHQYIKGTTMTIVTPSVTKTRFSPILNGLKNIEDVLAKMK